MINYNHITDYKHEIMKIKRLRDIHVKDNTLFTSQFS